METITNAASSVTSTVSNLIYGQPAKENETSTNETGGKEPLSGEQGKGTVNEPYDQGNSENPVKTASSTNTAVPASGNTSYKEDDFLKLDPAMGKPATTDSSTDTKTGTGTGNSSLPIIPLSPDTSTSSSGPTNTTSATGISDKTWKPTELDDVKPSGAPGAGPEAPDYKPATPDMSSTTSNKPAEHHDSVGAAKDGDASKKQSGFETSHSDTAQAQPSVGGPIEDILNKGTSSKDEHTVPENEAEDPHSKMNDKTVRATHAHKTDVGEVESHPAETPSRASESSKPADPASPGANDEKSEKKMSQLKDKLKNKLHIGSKDK